MPALPVMQAMARGEYPLDRIGERSSLARIAGDRVMSANIKKPTCELCSKRPATSFAYFDEHQPGRRWLFSCPCSDEKQDYSVSIDDFFATPAATVDRLTRLNQKTWIDWREFMGMIERFREVTQPA